MFWSLKNDQLINSCLKMSLRSLFLSLILLITSLQGKQANLDSNSFYLGDYQNVAIATDLEPDDVLALKIIFQKANQLYQQDPLGKYPIELIIVGEGNTAIKRMRMVKLLDEFFELPEGILVKVVEGKSTKGNIFPYDGEELFSKAELVGIPYIEKGGEEATVALLEFLKASLNPLMIQLKPAQELFEISLHPEISSKTSILFYGSFNLRKTVEDPVVLQHRLFDPVRNPSKKAKLQTLIDHFAGQFLKVGVVESYGLLGLESSVFAEHPWTHPIADVIDHSEEPFLKHFVKLTENWNAYLFRAELEEQIDYLLTLEGSPLIRDLAFNFAELLEEWNEPLFLQTYQSVTRCMLDEKLQRGMKFAYQLRPNSGIQFTLADVGVALATTDSKGLFKALPVSITVNPKGFLETSYKSDSNLYYYQPIEKEKFVELLLQTFETF